MPYFTKNQSIDDIANILYQTYGNTCIKTTWEKRMVTPAFFCTMFRSDIFKKFLLDECYGIGWADDIDYCYRIMQYGYNLAYIPAAYVLHNLRTTFKSIYNEQQMEYIINSRITQAKIVNQLNPLQQKKGVIYTAIIGKYDKLPQHIIYNTKDFDYICFTTTDNINDISFPWKVFNVSDLLGIIDTKDKTKIARWFKTHPHMFFRNYQYSIWIDRKYKIFKRSKIIIRF